MPFDNYGGQLLPLEEMDLGEGDEVEVYYDQDREWGRATITEVTDYRDDLRFTVKYTADDATQTNVCFERIRKILKPAKKKGKKRKASTSPTPDESTSTAASSSSSTGGILAEIGAASPLPPSSSKKTKKAKVSLGVKVKTNYGEMGYIADTLELQLASKMGLPEGWAANIRPGSRFTFLNPDGTLKFTSKRAVFQYLGLPPPKHGHNPLLDDDDGNDEKNVVSNKGQNNKEVDFVQDPNDDPPWRTEGNDYLGRRIEYTFLDGVKGRGTITGWISDTDVDREGNPGFLSEKTNEPACLFHVTMDSDCAVGSQDFEEYELQNILMDGDE